MKTYFAIRNSENRYMKVRANGSRSWVEDLKGATIGTEAQMNSLIAQLSNSPYQAGCELVEVGESDSAWKAKLNAVK